MKDLASHIMDIVQNSIRAQASEIVVRINENHLNDQFIIEINDNGTGMDEATLSRVRDPFFTSRTVRKVGLGIPLLQQNAERTGGKLCITSALGQGTRLSVCFVHSHWDRPPLGNIAQTLSLLIAANPGLHFVYQHTTDHGNYLLDTDELKAIFGNIPLNHPDVVSSLEEFIRENLKEINADH